jgi:hypothetical protein
MIVFSICLVYKDYNKFVTTQLNNNHITSSSPNQIQTTQNSFVDNIELKYVFYAMVLDELFSDTSSSSNSMFSYDDDDDDW